MAHCENCLFWHWVASRTANDNPRGDFILDTRDLMQARFCPETRLGRLSENRTGNREYNALRARYHRRRHNVKAAAIDNYLRTLARFG